MELLLATIFMISYVCAQNSNNNNKCDEEKYERYFADEITLTCCHRRCTVYVWDKYTRIHAHCYINLCVCLFWKELKCVCIASKLAMYFSIINTSNIGYVGPYSSLASFALCMYLSIHERVCVCMCRVTTSTSENVYKQPS